MEEGKAMEIFNSLDPITDEARTTLLCGMARHNSLKKGWQQYTECKTNGVKLNVDGYNAALRCLPTLQGVAQFEKDASDVLQDMKKEQVRPNLDSLMAILRALHPLSQSETSQATKLALSIVADFEVRLLCFVFLGTISSCFRH